MKNRRRVEEIKRANRKLADRLDGGNLGPREAHAFIGYALRHMMEWLCWYHGVSTRDEHIAKLAEIFDEMECAVSWSQKAQERRERELQ